MRRAALGLFVALLLPACPRGEPCAFIDGEPQGQCHRLTCPRFASARDDGRCGCDGDAQPVLGGCLTPESLDAYCGHGATPKGGACVHNTCKPGEVLDRQAGSCIPPRSLRNFVDNVTLYEGETIGCRETAALLVSNDQISCVPPGFACQRGETWQKDDCKPATACWAGEVRDTNANRCVRVVRQHDDSSHIVDTATWARLAIGVDGGVGTSEFCAPLRMSPRAFTIQNDSVVQIEVRINLTFPSNDVTRVYSTAEARNVTGDMPLSGMAQAIVDQSLAALLVPLRAMGGISAAAVVTLRARCAVQILSRPQPVQARFEGAPDGGK